MKTDECVQIFCTKKKKKNKSKSLIRKARLVLPVDPKNDTKIKCKQRRAKHSKEIIDNYSNDSGDGGELQNSSSHRHLPKKTSCGSQYMNMTTHNIIYENKTDSQTHHELSEEDNANELASYFEQMLYIPKPMSLMAEMMYA